MLFTNHIIGLLILCIHPSVEIFRIYVYHSHSDGDSDPEIVRRR
jgi:hypothetical protein